MHKLALFIFIVVSLAALTSCQKSTITPSTGTQEVQANWSTDAVYGTFITDGYTLSNDMWGDKPGPQTLWVNSPSNWGVWSDQVGGGVKSYPNCGKYIGKTIESLKTLTSSFNITMPKTGCFDAAYDIWDSNNAHEIMLWVNTLGDPKPVGWSYNWSDGGPAVHGLVAGGHTWNVYRGTLFGHAVISFLRTSSTSSGTVNIKAILRWMKKEGWIDNVTMGNLQFGTEISTTAVGGSNFNTNSYSVTVD